MKKYYEEKGVDNSVMDVDTSSRRVKVAIAKMGNLDLDKDVIDHGAFTKTIAERGPSGKNLIYHLTDHYPSLKYAIGKFSELYTEKDYLVGVTNIPDTSWGNDMLEFYKSGVINQHSIGFRTIKREPVNAGDPNEYNLIKEILLYEGSAVLWGANPETPTLSVGKSEFGNDDLEKYKTLTKLMSDGHFTDETFEVLKNQLKQIEQNIINDFIKLKEENHKAGADETTLPESKELIDAIHLLTLKLF